MPRFAAVPSRARFAESELEILELWQRAQVFARSLEQREGAPAYVFYEGPPTANGLPGIHHVLARAFKDLFPRYKQMSGFRVERKAGWDTHGLPVEIEVEKSLHISGKKQIEAYGVAEFNRLCRESVMEYIDEWERMTERLGFWLDMEHPYRTYDSTYIESVWWSLRQLWDKGLLYEGYKVVPYCPRCQTSLSSHELSLGYRDDVADPSVYVKFLLEGGDGRTSLLAWTTTPWTLPGNVALAVHPDETYVRVRDGDDSLILAEKRLSVLGGEPEVLESMTGAALAGRRYAPLFMDMIPDGLAFVVVDAPELVSMDEGTGVVHTAAAYGVADLELCQERGIAVRHVVGLDGRFLDGQTRYRGMFVKDADPEIIRDLAAAGRLHRAGTIRHTYPFCWRCDSPLLYYALTSWFIRTTACKQELLDNNHGVTWQPAHVRDGRMGDWLQNLVDWNLSRTRYWGTPLPIWECTECDAKRCIGSAAEVGLTVADDLHKPHIDSVELACEACGAPMRRVPHVIDVWYDSGAMPFAQWHYPFENRERFERAHPADFICEAIDQTRGWFFSLQAISTLVLATTAYRNVVCLGLLVDKDGRKMSKSRGNTIDPGAAFADYGADATRWYFYSSVSAGGNYRVSTEALLDVQRRFMLTLWNVYSFFVSYANLDGYDPRSAAPPPADRPALDRWCLARLADLVDTVRNALDGYDATDACRAIEAYVDDLSRWYVRRSRERFWKSDPGGGAGVRDSDKRAAYATLYTALETLTRLLAPFMPFVSERMYRNLHGFLGDHPPDDATPDSVHLADYPAPAPEARDADLVGTMAAVRRLAEEGLAARERARVKVKQPLAGATVHGAALAPELEAILREELNVKAVDYLPAGNGHATIDLDLEITDELRLEGLVRQVSRKVNDLRKQADLALDERIHLYIDADGDVRRAVDAHRARLMRETLAREITFAGGDHLAEWQGLLEGTPCLIGIAR